MLSVDHLVCRAGSKVIVDDISAVFGPALLHVIVGPNGSGKSTFLQAFSGDRKPAALPLSSSISIALIGPMADGVSESER